MSENALDSTQSRQLRNQHPLYTKLSGDVVWLLYEERGYDAKACEQAMDAFIATMHSTLAVMHSIESGAAHHFIVQGKPCCTQYRHLAGKIFAASGPNWREYLPPYAVGCPLTCRLLAATELPALHAKQDIRPPSCGLFCPCL